jgi:general secretion pathway protein H
MAAGFSLLELLVVLAIIVLIASVALPRLTGPSEGARLQTAVRDLMAALRLTRAAAVTQNREMALVVDLDRRILQSPVVAPQRLSDDIASQMTIAETERATASRGAFRFFPDGSSTGAAGDDRKRRVRTHRRAGKPTPCRHDRTNDSSERARFQHSNRVRWPWPRARARGRGPADGPFPPTLLAAELENEMNARARQRESGRRESTWFRGNA